MPSFRPGSSSAAGRSSRRLSTNVLPCQFASVCSKPLHGDIEERLGIAAVELDLGEIEEAPGLVEWRILLRLALAERARRARAPFCPVPSSRASVHLHTQLQRIEQRIGMATGYLVRLLIGGERLREALRPLEDAAERGVGVEILVVELYGAAQRSLAGAGSVSIACFALLCDLVLDDTFLAPRFAIERRRRQSRA